MNEDIQILDFSSMNYNKIKDYTDEIKAKFSNYSTNSDEIYEIANLLGADNRKNVRSLSDRLINFIKDRTREIERVKKMYNFDNRYLDSGYVAGVDEVGRGPLAGPIVAASVILDLNTSIDSNLLLGIKDSKKLSSKAREELSELIKSKAISYSIAELDNNDIDAKGTAWCNNEVFKMAIGKLSNEPRLVLSDGYPIKNFHLKNEYVIKGDEQSASIACASIVAKVYRDNLMKEYSKIYPYYAFEENAGYGSKEHIDAIKKYGPCKIHRMYFLRNIL